MNFKTIIFFLLVASIVLGCTKRSVYADEEAYSFAGNWADIEQLAVETDPASGSALIANALYLNARELDSISHELRTISALLLILAVFETMRIARSWTKGIGVK